MGVLAALDLGCQCHWPHWCQKQLSLKANHKDYRYMTTELPGWNNLQELQGS